MAEFKQLETLFSKVAVKPKWKCISHFFEKKASCFELSSDGDQYILVGDQSGKLNTLRILGGSNLTVCDEAEQHQTKIADVTMNPSSDLIASCSNENKIELASFDASIYKIGDRRIRMSMNDPVRALTFMEDLGNRSNILFSGSGKNICITDCSCATTFRVLNGHNGVVTSFCTWGGCMFASSSTDRTIRIWDMRVTNAVRVFDPLDKTSTSGAFHIDGSGRCLIRGDVHGQIHLFDTTSTKSVTKMQITENAVTSLRIANYKHFVLVADAESLQICNIYQNMRPVEVAKTTSRCFALRWDSTRPIFYSLDAASQLSMWQLSVDD